MIDQFPGGADLHEIPGGKLFVHEDRADELVARCRGFPEDRLGVAREARPSA